MSALKKLMKKHTGYTFTSQYCLVSDEWNTFLSFFNYYEQVFPGKGIVARLLVVFHDEQGNELMVYEQDVPPGSTVQVDARKLGITQSGLVVVAAVAMANLEKLAAGKFKVNGSIPTSFYVTWDRANSARDMMHEWEGVAQSQPIHSTHYAGMKYSEQIADHGFMLTNPNLNPSSGGKDFLTLRSAKNGKTVAKAEMDRLSSMGSKIIKFKDYFPNLDVLFREHDQLVMALTTSAQAAPLTAEWYKSGDFHFHHL
jgi:hypothetical protein